MTMSENRTATVRLNVRYAPVEHESALFLRRDSDGAEFRIEDIAVGGARYSPSLQRGYSEVYTLVLPEPLDPSELPPQLGVLNPIATHGQRPVLVFDESTRASLSKLLPELERRKLLRVKEDPDAAALRRQPPREPVEKVLEAVKRKIDDRPENAAQHVASWLERNAPRIATLGASAWPVILDALTTTFSRFYVSENLFARRLDDLLSRIYREGYSNIHVVPMRSIAGLAEIFGRHEKAFERVQAKWEPSLWKFMTGESALKPNGEDDCLIAIDSYLSQGLSRQQFLRLLARSRQNLGYRTIILASVVGHSNAQPLDASAFPGVNVRAELGWELPPEARPGEADAALAAFERETGHDRKRRSLVAFYYGAPFDTVSLFWSDVDEWVPLFRPLGYYNPSYRPIARAPFFSAYPETLNWLKTQVQNGGAALLYGPQGSGKTYLAARLAEVSLSSSYVFWYSCRRYDSVENLIENLDAFLATVGIGVALSTRLYKPFGDAELASELIGALRRLDRPAVLIFDGVENLTRSDDEARGVANPFTELVREFVAAAQQRAPDPITNPFLLLVVQESPISGTTVRRDNALAPFRSPAIDQLADHLGIHEHDRVSCPHFGADVFSDATPLARKLIRHPAAVGRYGRLINLLSHLDPYKTWLLCFWVNRCVRLGGGVLNEIVDRNVLGVLDARRAVWFSDVEFVHELIHISLHEHERRTLEVASAWTLPWSLDELNEVLATLQPSAGEPPDALLHPVELKETIDDLIEDRAPFLVSLGHGAEARQPGPFIPLRYSNGRDVERYEMPSVAARFFRERLGQSSLRASVHLRMASVMERRHARTRNTAGSRSLATALLVESILHRCNGGKPSLAAKTFSAAADELRRLSSRDRILQLGRAILAAEETLSPNGGTDPEFDLSLRCETAVLHANALAEAARPAEARRVCTAALRYLESAPKARALTAAGGGRRNNARFERMYWTCRFELIEAKCRRCEQRNEDALAEYRRAATTLEELMKSGASEYRIAFWAGRGRAAEAQCLLSMGRMAEAEAALTLASRNLERMREKDRNLLNGLLMRHRGTILLLRGKLGEAEEEFRRLEKHATELDERRVAAIAQYKLSNVLLERVREWEAVALSSQRGDGSVGGSGLFGDAPRLQDVTRWLDAVRSHLEAALRDLRRYHGGDQKWFPAIDLWDAEWRLFTRRLGVATDLKVTAKCELDAIRTMLQRLKSRAHTPAAERNRARDSEMLMMETSLKRQAAIESAESTTELGFVRELCVAYHIRDPHAERYDSPTSEENPYRRSRAEYENMYYLWRALELTAPSTRPSARQWPSYDDTIDAAARAYRRGTDILYSHRMAAAARPLHRLAIVLFTGKGLGLQELLEAATCLELPAESVQDVLGRISREALRHLKKEHDEFFVIPAKVICRLLGNSDLYWELAQTGLRSSGRVVARGREQDPYMVRRARVLAMESYNWTRDTNWEQLAQEANTLPGDTDERIAAAREGAERLKAWLREFIEVPDVPVKPVAPPKPVAPGRRRRRRREVKK